MKKLVLLFWILLGVQTAFAQEKVEGILINTENKPINNIKIRFQNTEPSEVTTNSRGFFVVYSLGEKPIPISFSAHKMVLKTIIYTEKVGEKMKIIVTKAFELKGKILDKKIPVVGAKFEIVGLGEAITDKEGKFSLHLPEDFQPKSVQYKLNGISVSYNDFNWKDADHYLETKPDDRPKLREYEISLFDEKGDAIRQVLGAWGDATFKTNASGIAKLQSILTEEKVIASPFAVMGYEFIKVEHLTKTSFRITIRKSQNQDGKVLPTAPLQEVPKKAENTPPVTQISENNLEKIDTLKNTKISENFNVDHIIGVLEMEKQELTARRFKIEQDIRNIESLLRKGQLSEQETNFLKKELQRLENALIENHIAYENAQNQTRNLIDSVKNVVYQRGVLEQKLEQVQRLAMQQAIIFSVIAVLLGALLWIFFMSKRRSQEQNKKLKEANRLIEEKNTVLNVQKEEISAQAESLKDANKIILEKQDVLEKQSHEINQKNESIIASINYASRIQGALLPTLSAIKEHLPQIFVLYKPRDIVSGDLYWFFEKNDKMISTAADCTGHGVPGALMSMIGMEQLNEIINIHHIFSPKQILTKLDEGIKKHLKQDENQVRDGMDIAMILLNKNKNEVIFSGAKNPLYYVHQNQNPEIVELKGTVKAIGGRETRTDVFFEAKTVVLEANQETMFYLMSDGYEDQFGGEKGKKFMKKNLRELLFSIHAKPVEEQHEILDHTIEKWKNGKEQTDDILIIGLRWKGRDALQN